MFNASMCLYYLDYLASEEKEPLQLMDPAVAQDLSKIEKILALGRPEFVEEVVEQAVRGERIPFDGGLTLLNLQNSDYFTDQAVLSALFYLGFLTYVPGEEEELVVPNRAIAQQFYDYRFKTLRRFTNWVVSRRFLDKTLAPLAAGNPEPWLREAERLLDLRQHPIAAPDLAEDVGEVRLVDGGRGHELVIEARGELRRSGGETRQRQREE